MAVAVLVLAFVATQRAGRARLMDMSLFRRGRFLAATVAAFGTGLGVIATMSFACTFLVRGLGMGTLEAGALLAVWSGTSAVAALVFARFSAAVSGAVPLVVGLVGVAIGLALFTVLPADSSPVWMLPGLFVAGAASGLLNTGLAREAVAGVPARNAAMGTGANNTARYIGASVGVTVAGAVAGGQDALVVGWNLVALIGAGTSLASALLVVCLSRTRGLRRTDPQPERSPR